MDHQPDIQHDPDDAVHVVLIGTKPDIIKQGPVYHELKDRGHRTLLCHTGQHLDSDLLDANLGASFSTSRPTSTWTCAAT